MSDSHGGHTVHSFDRDLTNLTGVLVQMGELALRQVRDAARALLERDDALAREVVAREKELNAFDTHGEEVAIQLIAKRQPMGVDLRTIIVTLKGFTELERIGDEAKKVAKIARRMILDELDPVDVYRQSFTRMVKAAEDSLEKAMKALREQDAGLAIEVVEGDRLLDMEYKDALRAIHEGVMARPALLPVAAEAVLIIKAVERVGDHAKNIAKHVLYLVEGKDVRHVKGKRLAEALGKAEPEAS
jgi:phosphate transport system protein